jgi:hypothetical protein
VHLTQLGTDPRFPTVERERVAWRPGGADREFVLELEELFRPIRMLWADNRKLRSVDFPHTADDSRLRIDD